MALRILNVEYTPDFKNKSSKKYKEFERNFMNTVRKQFVFNISCTVHPATNIKLSRLSKFREFRKSTCTAFICGNLACNVFLVRDITKLS